MNALFVMTFVCLNCGVETMLFPGELPSHPPEYYHPENCPQRIPTSPLKNYRQENSPLLLRNLFKFSFYITIAFYKLSPTEFSQKLSRQLKPIYNIYICYLTFML